MRIIHQCSESFVTMDSKEVEERCNVIISQIEIKRAELLDEFIEVLIKEHRQSIVRRILRRPIMTRDPAMQTSEYDQKRTLNQQTYGIQYEVAKLLLNASKCCDKINVSVYDLQIIT